MPPDVILMLEHYFQMELDDHQKHRVQTAMTGGDNTRST
jgi:hypothetical protein